MPFQNKKLFQIFFLLILFGGFFGYRNAWAACGGLYAKEGNTFTTYDSSNECVQQAIDSAVHGDTIVVQDGSATWSPAPQGCTYDTYLCTNKAIKLIGGAGTITLSPGTIYGGVRYIPDASAVSHTFEITGFTFDALDGNLNNMGVIFVRPSVANEFFSAFKIHHNTFKNVGHTAIMIDGLSYGATYQNIFTNVSYPQREENGGAWGVVEQKFGQRTNIFFEDNLINIDKNYDEMGVVDPGHGTPGLVYRYNTVDMTGGALSSQTSVWSAHGLQSMHVSYFLSGTATGGSSSTLVDSTRNFAEEGVLIGDTVMRNTEYQVTYSTWQVTSITTTVNPNDTLNFTSKNPFVAGDSYHVSHYTCPSGCGYDNCTNTIGAGYEANGGLVTMAVGSCSGTDRVCNRESTLKFELYGNKIVSGNHYFTTFLNTRGGANLFYVNYVEPKIGVSLNDYYKVTYAQYACDTCSVLEGFVMRVTNSYNWSNYASSQLRTMEKGLDGCKDACDGYEITENIDYFNHNLSYDGVTEKGVFCGSVLPGHCAVGDGAWITNQSCSNLTDYVGEDPTTPISGTLYKCTSTDTWEQYYKPYVYPHPLRRQFRSDLDVDDDVDIFDYNTLIGNFGVANDCNKPDADLDCDVDIFDYSILLGEFGSGT